MPIAKVKVHCTPDPYRIKCVFENCRKGHGLCVNIILFIYYCMYTYVQCTICSRPNQVCIIIQPEARRNLRWPEITWSMLSSNTLPTRTRTMSWKFHTRPSNFQGWVLASSAAKLAALSRNPENHKKLSMNAYLYIFATKMPYLQIFATKMSYLKVFSCWPPSPP